VRTGHFISFPAPRLSSSPSSQNPAPPPHPPAGSRRSHHAKRAAPPQNQHLLAAHQAVFFTRLLDSLSLRGVTTPRPNRIFAVDAADAPDFWVSVRRSCPAISANSPPTLTAPRPVPAPVLRVRVVRRGAVRSALLLRKETNRTGTPSVNALRSRIGVRGLRVQRPAQPWPQLPCRRQPTPPLGRNHGCK
jgi:hypothetical protein